MSIKTSHCAACGIDPFDKTYGIGYEVGHKDWSPYPRVNRLRRAFLDREYLIDVERFRNVTQAYKDNEGATTKIRCARAFEQILMNATLRIYEDELILCRYRIAVLLIAIAAKEGKKLYSISYDISHHRRNRRGKYIAVLNVRQLMT